MALGLQRYSVHWAPEARTLVAGVVALNSRPRLRPGKLIVGLLPAVRIRGTVARYNARRTELDTPRKGRSPMYRWTPGFRPISNSLTTDPLPNLATPRQRSA